MPGTLLSPVLIGRAHELEVLDRVLHEAQNGAGSCVLLSGEAGIGKSRLATELSKHAATSGFLILQGHCSEQDRSYPYAPWVDALRALLATPDAVKINPWTETFAPELVKLLPELALLLPAIQPTAPLDPAAEKHRLFETLTRFVTALTADRPVLIVLEDLHWSDEQSLEFLQFFLRRILTVPILVLGTYRSEDAYPRFAYHLLALNREHLADELQLAPLARAEVAQMAQAILPTEQPVRSDWLYQLMAFTEGNPFFVEEMLKTLEPNDAPPGKVDQLPIPRSIQQSIQRRVEGLPEETRYILALASVIGERFGFDLLQAISGEDETALLHRLKALITAQLIVEQSVDQFAFRHALTREVVYATLLFRERRAMHQTIGETLERIAKTPVEVPAASLAYHFYKGGEWQKALAYAQRAGHEAQALYAPREALEHFTHALDAAQQLGTAPQLSTWCGRAQAYEVLGEFDHARSDYEAALALASQGTDRLDEWQALIDLGFLWQSRNLERAGEYYQRALELARMIEDPSVLAKTLNRVGNWHFNRGQPREALPYHREALALFQLENDRHGMAHTLDLLGIVSYQLGAVVQGTEYLEQAVPILRALDDRQALVNTLANLTMRALTNTEVLGEINYLQLVDLSDEALQIARHFYWYQGEVLALMQGAISLERAGEYGQALGRLAQAQSIAEEGRNRESFSRLHLIYGQVFTGLMALDEAKQHFETALAYLQELGSGLLVLGAKTQLANVAVLQSDFARAHALLADLLPAETPKDQEPAALRGCWSVCAELALAQGNPRRALAIVERLLAATLNLAQYGPYAVPRLSRLRGQALTALDRMEEAEAELQGALQIAFKHGQRPMVWRLHADLGRVYRAMGRGEEAGREFTSARMILHDLAKHLPEGTLRDHFLRQALATLPAAPVLTARQTAKKEYGGLTAREREIATLITLGKSNREIADALVISETTAERHVANILSKLGFNSRTQIAVWAVEKGLGS